MLPKSRASYDDYSQVVWKQFLQRYSVKATKINRNYNLSQININFSKYAFGATLPAVYTKNRMLRYFAKVKLTPPYRKAIYFRTFNSHLFNFFINRTTFNKKNPIHNLSKSLEAIWNQHSFTSYYSISMDQSPEFLQKKIEVVEKQLHKVDRLRWRYDGMRPSWIGWRYGLKTRQNSLTNYLSLYMFVGLWTTYAIQQKVFFAKRLESHKPYFILFWTFTKTHRLYLNMRNSLDTYYNYFSLFPGFFLKFYKNRRPLKRTKLFKVLLVRFLRKLLIAGNVKTFNLVVNRSPTIFIELYKLFITPDIVPYKVPTKKSLYLDSDVNAGTSVFRAQKFIFSRTKFYGLYRERRRGRLKRKVARRLIKKNSIMD